MCTADDRTQRALDRIAELDWILAAHGWMPVAGRALNRRLVY